MRKFLAVAKHEYKRLVLKWSFLIGTLLFPFLAACFAIVPAIIFSLKGEPTRIVIIDTTNKIAPRVRENLSPRRIAEKAERALRESATDLNASGQEDMKRSAEMLGESFVFVDIDFQGKPYDELRRELNSQIAGDQLDAYLLIPADFEKAGAKFEFFSRKAGDFITNETLKDALNEAVRSQRLADANISEEKLRELSKNVDFVTRQIDEKGNEKDSESLFFASLIIGLLIYITLTIYGNMIMGAVVEEKETRIAEILFSSARPFDLLLGKLFGVGFAGLTQLAIWIVSAMIAVGVGAVYLSAAGFPISVPNITPLMVVYFLIFFLLGFFIYASMFALIGSMVTSMQEGGQFAFPPVLILLIGFYFSFAVTRDPNSTLSFWVSVAPFMAPITMPVRILAETPPFWQILLSIFFNGAAIAGMVWLAARVYRIGMLMYGKRATIPEVWKWIRQS